MNKKYARVMSIFISGTMAVIVAMVVAGAGSIDRWVSEEKERKPVTDSSIRNLVDRLRQANFEISRESDNELTFVACRFDVGKDEINMSDADQLKQRGKILRGLKAITDYLDQGDMKSRFYITISGHTDKREYRSEVYIDRNMELSLRRAMYIYGIINPALSQQVQTKIPFPQKLRKYNVLLKGYRDMEPLKKADSDNRRAEIGISLLPLLL